MTMNRSRLWNLIAIPAFVLLSLQLPLQAAEQGHDRAIRAVDKLVAAYMEEHGVPGMSVAIAHENELVCSKGYGLADVEHSVPATPETRYRTGSIAKPLTAALILALAEDGRLKLDDSVENYVPEFKDKGWPVSSRQLLGHLGGVRHYKSAAEASSTAHFFNLKSALRTFASDPLIHQPGTKYKYSSFGYNLLGSVAEGAGKDDFMSLLRQEVLSPAELQHTVADNVFSIVPHRASGYFRATKSLFFVLPGNNFVEGELYNCTLHDTSMKIPGGGLLSTAADLVKFATVINTGSLLSDDSRTAMWTAQQTSDGKQTNYGLGWSVGKKSNQNAVWHGGSQSGTSTMLLLYPESGTCVAIMSNLQRLSLTKLAVAIAETVQPPTHDYLPAVKKLKAAVRYEVEQKELPAFSISLIDGDNIVWADGFGFQDAQKTRPATAETVYRVGSISKLFTDVAVMQLVEEGRIDLDAPVQTYVPDFKPHNSFGDVQTLRQMMSHQSGLVRESPVGHYFDPDEPSLSDTVLSLNGTKLVYRPDTKTKYSNAAVSVVGMVLENELDSTHPERVRQTILNPLNMKNSSFVVSETVAGKLAVGWMRTYDGRRFEAPGFLLGTGPAGNMYSSVTDLARFVSCLFNEGRTATGSIIKPETLAQMTTPIRNREGKPQGFGLGFHIQKLDGHTKIGHGGAVYGFSTQLEALPERRLGAVAASALDGTNGVARRLTDYALRLMIAVQDGQPLPDYHATIPLPRERAAELTGRYREVGGDRFAQISELNGDVYLHRGSFRYELRAAAVDGTVMTDDEIGFNTIVKRTDDGRLKIGDTDYRRLPDSPPPTIPDRWQGLIGEYGWDHNTLYILEEDEQLYALIEWFYYYPLEEVTENVYRFPDYGLYHGEGLTFKRDENGIATEVNAAEVVF